MRAGATIVIAAAGLLGCASVPRDSASAVPRTAAEWTQRCATHLEAARRAVLPRLPLLAQATVKIEPAPWNPTLRFEARGPGGAYYEGAVSHGRSPCIDFDTDDPAYLNLRWSNGAHARRVTLDRIRRLAGDEAWLQADRVPTATLHVFRRAFEQALELCLEDARPLPLGEVPKTVSCLDQVDRCPDEADATNDDGCPVKPSKPR